MERRDTPNNDRDNVRDSNNNDLKDKVILALLAVLLGGGSGMLFGRPDPWTATQARLAHEEIMRDIERCEKRMDSHVSIEAHPSANERLRQHERQIQEIWKILRNNK